MVTYKGIVCKSQEDEFYLMIVDDFGYKFIPITDHLGNYKNLGYEKASVCGVRFFDGTEQVDYEHAISRMFEDIFIAIEDFGDITSPHENLYETLRNDYDEILGIWEIIDDIFKIDAVIEKFEQFKIRDFYGRTSTENSED